jgi:putative ABC transport system substrate-binding protein
MRVAVFGFVVALSVALRVLPMADAAAQQREPPRVGVLHPGYPPPATPSPIVEGLRDGLREIGYVEGRTIRLEYRYARGNPEVLPKLAAELTELKVDVLIAVSMPALRAARDIAGTTPIVITDLQIDPIASGLARTFARPGGNITGLFLDLPGLTGKWLELVREVAPSARRVAVLWDSTTGTDQLRAIQGAAQTVGLELQIVEVRTAGDYDHALTLALKGRPQALVQLSSPVIQQSGNRVAAFALKNRVPAVSMFSSFADAGGLIAYGPDLVVFFRRAATYVDRILKGATPADLPIERPTRYELTINSRTAKTLSLTLPPSLLVRADRVIQ